ncbi:MAG: Gldg family protein [Polyangiaceae bacterium]|nr:Gldg family protein [Polyangiaceae bacterium]
MKLAATVSLMSVIVLATVGNVFASRHFVRWDFTTSGEFTLSDGTVDTLKALDEKVTLVVLVSRDTPIGTSIAELLEGYQQHTKMLEIEFVDVDRDRARLLELQKLYGIETAEADGHTVIDAAMIVIQGDRHRYVLGGELVEVEDAADMRARPRLEYAITSAIRHVRATKPPVICFTTGHNELSFEKSGGEGMAELRDTLRKNNFEVATVFEPTADAPSDPLVGCQMLVVATPRAEIPKEHALAMVRFVEGGGNALVVLGPMPNKSQTDFVDVGLGDLLALAGVKVEKDYVHELDPSMIPRDSDGSTYFADAQVHPVTEKLIREQAAGIGALLSYSSSLTDAGARSNPSPCSRRARSRGASWTSSTASARFSRPPPIFRARACSPWPSSGPRSRGKRRARASSSRARPTCCSASTGATRSSPATPSSRKAPSRGSRLTSGSSTSPPSPSRPPACA